MFCFSLVILHASLLFHVLMTFESLDFTNDTNTFILRREISHNLMHLPKGRKVGSAKNSCAFCDHRT